MSTDAPVVFKLKPGRSEPPSEVSVLHKDGTKVQQYTYHLAWTTRAVRTICYLPIKTYHILRAVVVYAGCVLIWAACLAGMLCAIPLMASICFFLLGNMFFSILNAWDFATVMLKIAAGVDPHMEAYWRRRGYNEFTVEFMMRDV